MKRVVQVTAILVFLLGSISTAQMGGQGKGMAAGCGGGRGHGDGMMGHCDIMSCAKELNLTEDQISKIKEINFAHRNSMIDAEAELEKAQLKMRHETVADSPDKAAVLAASREVNAIRGRIAESRINHMFDLQSVLNEEQLKKWQACRKQCGEKCGPGMGHGMMDRGGHSCMPGCTPGHGERLREGRCRTGKNINP